MTFCGSLTFRFILTSWNLSWVDWNDDGQLILLTQKKKRTKQRLRYRFVYYSCMYMHLHTHAMQVKQNAQPHTLKTCNLWMKFYIATHFVVVAVEFLFLFCFCSFALVLSPLRCCLVFSSILRFHSELNNTYQDQ